jgi:hypothetical protein
VVVRPDEHRREDATGRCVTRWSDEEIAAGARVVMMGSFRDVRAENFASSPPERCQIESTHEARGRYVKRLRDLSADRRGPPLRIVHEHRFDIVAPTLAAEPGFRADFLVSTDRPWKQVLDFYERDRSPLCGLSGCRFSMRPDGAASGHELTLDEAIDASGGPKRHESAVFYTGRGGQVQSHYWASAVIADLRNPAYRAWRVKLAAQALEIGGYDAVSLNQKFHMYQKHYWVGSDLFPDPAAVRKATDDNPWTAPPRGYGYPEYVAGWSALAADLRAAGVPYAIDALSAWPWVRDRADDPATRDRDEGRTIRDVVRGARLVLMDKARRDPAGLQRWVAELRAAGVEVVPIDTNCGYGRP